MALGCSPADDEDAGPLPPRDCPDSALPAPFCHRTVDAGSLYGWKHYRLGVLNEMRGETRPFLGATLHPLSFALFDPLDLGRALVEVPGPFPNAGNVSQLAAGDFDGDGAEEIAVSAGAPGVHDSSLIVLDGRTLETKAIASTEATVVLALDTDGDGEAELLTLTGEDENRSLHAWVVRDGSLVEVGTAALPFEQRVLTARGDFDGDSQLDLAMTAFDSADTPAPLVLLRGGSAEGTTLPLETFARPAPLEAVVAADMDGDDDHELVVFHTGSTMTVIDWTEEGLTDFEPLAFDSGSDRDPGSVTVAVGEDRGRPDWLLIGRFYTPDEPHWDGAFFPGRTETHFIRFEFDPLLVADYNGDGLSDFTVPESNAIVYLSEDDSEP